MTEQRFIDIINKYYRFITSYSNGATNVKLPSFGQFALSYNADTNQYYNAFFGNKDCVELYYQYPIKGILINLLKRMYKYFYEKMSKIYPIQNTSYTMKICDLYITNFCNCQMSCFPFNYYKKHSDIVQQLTECFNGLNVFPVICQISDNSSTYNHLFMLTPNDINQLFPEFSVQDINEIPYNIYHYLSTLTEDGYYSKLIRPSVMAVSVNALITLK